MTFLRLLLCMWAWRCQLLCAAARPWTHSALLACAQRIVLMLVAAEDGAAADCAYVRTWPAVAGWWLSFCSCACSNEPAHCSCCLEVRQTMGQV